MRSSTRIMLASRLTALARPVHPPKRRYASLFDGLKSAFSGCFQALEAAQW